ncbi:TIGR00366 family protein [Wenzhouxiangella sp. XN24]|uniref:YfcC family protein n=1 Tax=Wenzhouxiangella sp. XN24 TaxID=2713569 RepID=UPI0013EDB30C|nr:TIGR00366 family protein [Wenzhouxiangella sp. XN24]NGX16508.1 YfcC family protein [Wenzhouxiangella sp. XN24]
MSRTLKVPDTLVLLFGMMVLALVATWLLPQGAFQTVVNEAGREVVVPGTFAVIEDAPTLMPWDLITVVPRALADAQDIIFFVLIVGGAIRVLRATGTIDAFLGAVLRRVGHSPGLLIVSGMGVFAAGSATLGVAEEYIPLTLVLIALCVAMRMDTVTAIGIMVCGYGIGYGVAALNPFTVLVAQSVAEVPPASGLGFRLALFVPFLAIGIHHVWRYARRVQADPTASLVHDIPAAQHAPTELPAGMDTRQRIVGVLTLIALGAMVYGIVFPKWYIAELGAIFLALAIVAGLAGGLGADGTARRFAEGAAELAGTALLIGFARSIALLLEDGQVLHTIVNSLASPLQMMGAEFAAIGMLAIQTVINLFIPSGSGQAYVTMPLMAPIGDLVGVTRQTAVLAFQFGDGFANMIVPTNPVLMGILGLAGIPYDRWLRFVWPLLLKLFVAGSIALVIAVTIGLQ